MRVCRLDHRSQPACYRPFRLHHVSHQRARTLDDGTTGGKIIIDNTAPLRVTLAGAWTAGTTSTTYYGANYIHDGNVDKGTKSARFTPDFPAAAIYSVYVRWPAGANRANNVTQDAGDFAYLRNLTLNSNAGLRAVPPDTYGTFIANSSTSFVLGIAGATTPAIYQLQNLTLNGNSQVQVVGPVVLILANGLTLNGDCGSEGAPKLLWLQVANGGLTLNGGAKFHGIVEAPTAP